MGADDSRLEVLLTTSTFPYRPGDNQARFILDLATAMSETAGVTVLAPDAPGAQKRERVGPVEVRRFSYFLPRSLQRLAYGAGMRHNIDHSWLARIQVPLLLAAQSAVMAWMALWHRPSVINAHWLAPQGLTASLIARIFDIPLVTHVHAADVYFLRRFRFGSRLARFVVASSSSVLADGSHVRDSLDDLLGFPSRAQLRPMGVWISQFHGGPGEDSPPGSPPERFVLFVGRLVEKKGVEYLIRAVRVVRDVDPDLDLVVVGDGPLLGELRQLGVEQGISHAVHFVGNKDHDEVSSLMRRAEIVCVPSIIDSKGETEGMPTVVLEGLAAGARVVGSDVDGIPDVLRQRENGWLVPPADAGALAEGILRALGDDDGDAIASTAAATAEQNDWEAVAGEYLSILGKATEG